MKKKSSYILAGLAVIPIASALVINSISHRTTYYMANESGNRKEMSSVKLESLQDTGSNFTYNTKVTVSADDIKAEKDNDYYMYGSYSGIKANKDLFRGKGISDKFVDESENYACYAAVEQRNSQYYIDLAIKDLKSGDIKKKQYDLDLNFNQGYYSTNLVKISDGFVNVVLQKTLIKDSDQSGSSEDNETLVNYKFELSTANFLKEFEIGKKITAVENSKGNTNIYLHGYHTNSEGKDDDEGNILIYNPIIDTVQKVIMPERVDIGTVIENNDSLYVFDYAGEVIERTADGKFKEKIKLVDKKADDNTSFGSIKIKDNKIYAVYSKYDAHGQKFEQESIKIYALDTGKQLYSGDIMKKRALSSKAEAAGGVIQKFI